MKAFTSLEQSKKLVEILPIESADMCYPLPCEDRDKPLLEQGGFGSTPCWSLAALFNYLRGIDFFPNIEADEHNIKMSISYYDEEEARPLAPVHDIKVENESFIDACYEIILRLHELKML